MPVDKQKLAALLEKTQKKYGRGALYLLGSKYEIAQIERISTGLGDLDEITGGGLPVGRFLEMYGPEGAGKTSMAYHFCGRVSLSIYVNMEGTFDPTRAKQFVNGRKMLIRRPDWGEQAWEIMLDAADAGVPLIVLDSVPAMIPRGEFERNKKDTEDAAKMAVVAKQMSEKLPILATYAEKSGSTVLLVNQVRDNIGVMWGDPLTTPGGRAIRHYASIRMQIARKQWISKTIKGKGKTVGMVARLKIVKSKVCTPQGEAELTLDFVRGWINNG